MSGGSPPPEKKWDDNWAARKTARLDESTPRVAAIIRDWVRVIEGKRVLEAGCGAGLDSAQLARWGAETHLMDLSPGAVRLARDNYKENGVDGGFSVSDLKQLPFRDGAFDIVFNRGVVEHFLDPVEVLREMARVSSGWVIIFVPYKYTEYTINKRLGILRNKWPFPWETEYSLKELKSLCAEAGLKVLGRRGVAYPSGGGIWKSPGARYFLRNPEARDFVEENFLGVVEIGVIARKQEALSSGGEQVPADVYDDDYFRVCEGFSNPQSKRISRVAELMDIKPGMRVLDLGCGRGEHLKEAAGRGAIVTGADYSLPALRMARERVGDKASLVATDAMSLPFADNSFDLVLLIDIVEHLHDGELDKLFSEVRRALAPNGSALIHTAPNRLFIKYGHNFLSAMSVLLQGRTPKKYPRSVYLKMAHVNEQTPESLRRRLEPFFDADVFLEQGAPGISGDSWFLEAVEKLSKTPALRQYLNVDIYAKCRPKNKTGARA